MKLISRLRDNWTDCLIWLWILFIASSDLKVNIDPHIHWIGTGIVILITLPLLFYYKNNIKSYLKFKDRNSIIYIGSVSFFLLGLLLSATHSPNHLYDLAEAGKLIIILIGATFLFISIPKYTHIAFYSLESSTYLNIILLLIGILLFPSIAKMMFPGRWGTFLNFPGSLWKVGMATFFYGAYAAFSMKNNKVKNILLLLSSIILIYMDGARTGFLLLLLGIVLILILFLKERRFKTALLSLIFFIVVISGFKIIDLTNISHVKSPTSGLQRFSTTVQSSDLSAADPTRYKMLNDAWKAIVKHPLLGSGIGTTRTKTHTGPMVIHMTYLQIWADMGLISLLAYIGLILGWIIWCPNIIKRISNKPTQHERALYYNALYMLICFAITGLFNPLSTEWSDWLYFFIPYAFLTQLLPMRTGNVKHDCYKDK